MLFVHQLSQSKEMREVEDGQDEGGEKGRSDEEGMVKVEVHRIDHQ
jgi:hypothetical protein